MLDSILLWPGKEGIICLHADKLPGIYLWKLVNQEEQEIRPTLMDATASDYYLIIIINGVCCN